MIDSEIVAFVIGLIVALLIGAMWGVIFLMW